MSELKTNLEAILQEKQDKIIPENIKKDVQIFDVIGTYEGSGSSSNGDVKLFETVEEMQADENSKEGDLAVVYRNKMQNMTADSQTQYITFPETVILPEAFTGNVNGRLLAIDSSVMFDGNIRLNQTSFRFDGYSENGMIRVEYSSSDGITYTRTRFSGNREDLTNPVDLGTIVKYKSMESWNDAMGYFMQIGGNVFEGLYQAQSYPALFNMKYNVDIMYNTENSKTELTSDEIQLNAYDAVQLCKDLDDVVDSTGYYTMVVTEIKNNIVSKGVIYPGVVSLYKHTDGTIYTNVSVAESSTSYTVSKIEFDVNNKTTQKTELPIIVLQVGTMYCKCVEPVNTTNNYIYVFNFDKPDELLVRCTYDNSVYSSRYEQTYETLNRYTLTPNQLTAIAENIYNAKAYSKDGVIEGTLTQTVSNQFNDTNAEVYAKIQSEYDKLEPRILTDEDKEINKTIHTIPSKTDGTPLLNTGELTDMNSLFQSCVNLVTIPQLDTSSAVNMQSMFMYCTNLATIPLLDTSKVTDMSYMFHSCTNLTTIPLLDTSSATDIRSMFENCEHLMTVPDLNTSSATNMSSLFSGCASLTSIPLLDASNVTDVAYMFAACTNLVTIPQLDTSKVTNMMYMFMECTNLSDDSLNNVLAMCANTTLYTGTKTLKYIGISEEQATKCTTLSNYEMFTSAGWTTGY